MLAYKKIVIVDSYVNIRTKLLKFIPIKFSTHLQKAGLAPFWSGIRHSKECHCSAVSSAEDCLQLDVHVPSGGGGGGWPVLVWVAGGAGQYNPRKLVLMEVIVVVVHHRYNLCAIRIG